MHGHYALRSIRVPFVSELSKKPVKSYICKACDLDILSENVSFEVGIMYVLPN